jgi:hypothetical protein
MAADQNTKSDIKIDVDETRKLIRITIKGQLSDTDLMDLDARRRLLPQFQSGFAVLSECLDVSKPGLTWQGIYKLAAVTQNDVNPVAIVTNNPIVFGMACTFEICANWKDTRVAVFSDARQRWLGERK